METNGIKRKTNGIKQVLLQDCGRAAASRNDERWGQPLLWLLYRTEARLPAARRHRRRPGPAAQLDGDARHPRRPEARRADDDWRHGLRRRRHLKRTS